MKKFFISAVAVVMAFAANARTEGGDNLVKNGSFDAEGLVQSIPGDWSWAPMNTCNNIETLPNWTVSTGGIWNGGIEVLCDPIYDLGDGIMRPEEDYHWLRMFTDTDNMWTSISATQKVTGLEVGKAYKLAFVVCGQDAVVGSGDGAWNQALGLSVTINEVDGDNLGKEIKKEQITDYEVDWTAREYDFVAPATEIYIQFFTGNWMPGDNHTQGWMGIDCVDLYDPNGISGVAEIATEANAPVEFFNLQGVRVANPENGLYIRRQGDKVTKVIL